MRHLVKSQELYGKGWGLALAGPGKEYLTKATRESMPPLFSTFSPIICRTIQRSWRSAAGKLPRFVRRSKPG